MWKDTLVVITSDNGGPMYANNAANNWPLKGYKFTSWEGGVWECTHTLYTYTMHTH
jgi:arylsulfatase I/J